jgi:hypothetical protein
MRNRFRPATTRKRKCPTALSNTSSNSSRRERRSGRPRSRQRTDLGEVGPQSASGIAPVQDGRQLPPRGESDCRHFLYNVASLREPDQRAEQPGSRTSKEGSETVTNGGHDPSGDQVCRPATQIRPSGGLSWPV